MLSKRVPTLIVLLSLPAAALLAWRGVVQLNLLKIPAPLWDLQAKDRICWGDSDLAGARPGDPPPQRVSETPAETLPADRAALVAWHVIQRHVGGKPLQSVSFYGEGPTLVRATFPDGVQRLTWRRISLISQDDMGMSGVAAAVYLDATTGQPLALVRDIDVCEPSWSPLFTFSHNEPVTIAWLQTSGPFLLLDLYLAILLLTIGVVWGIRRLCVRLRRAA